eukprot:355288-Chlamydomonas_euryale.AAC.1
MGSMLRPLSSRVLSRGASAAQTHQADARGNGGGAHGAALGMASLGRPLVPNDGDGAALFEQALAAAAGASRHPRGATASPAPASDQQLSRLHALHAALVLPLRAVTARAARFLASLPPSCFGLQSCEAVHCMMAATLPPVAHHRPQQQQQQQQEHDRGLQQHSNPLADIPPGAAACVPPQQQPTQANHRRWQQQQQQQPHSSANPLADLPPGGTYMSVPPGASADDMLSALLAELAAAEHDAALEGLVLAFVLRCGGVDMHRALKVWVQWVAFVLR